jgi:diguanylate cyclase (GGDEF)-like protein
MVETESFLLPDENHDENTVEITMKNNTAQFLSHVDIFSMLSESEMEDVLDSLHAIEFDEGETIFTEGDTGNTLFIVVYGKISISIRLTDGREREIAEFAAGDFFGEMSIFENAPRSATCRTKGESALLYLQKEDFMKLIQDHPYIAIKIMYRMLNITSQRLRDTGEFLSDMVMWGEKAAKRAVTDELTGMYNRRFLDDALEDYIRSSGSRAKPLSLIMIDLDNFREINELYSTKTGDQVILAVVEVFRKHLRAKDLIARYGGDEFTIILPNTDAEEAREIGENIRVEVAELDILRNLNGPIKQVTISQGISNFPENAEAFNTLLEMADQALYSAKKEGRNRVVVVKKE